MLQIAIFHATLADYLRSTAGADDQKNLTIALATSRRDELLAHAGTQRIDVLVADLALLGDTADTTLSELEQALKPELTIVVYAFAKWSTLEALRRPHRQLMRAPVSARALRSGMIGLIVKHLTRTPAAAAQTAPEQALMRLEQPAPMRRYDHLQLAALQDVRSIVDCECPNQVADLVLALNAFEDYSAQCQNRNEKDAQMHRLLARVTGHARAAMEYALKELCAFEGLDPQALACRSDRIGRAG